MYCYTAVMLYSIPTGSDAAQSDFLLFGDQESLPGKMTTLSLMCGLSLQNFQLVVGRNKFHLVSLTYRLTGPKQVIFFTRYQVHRKFHTLPCR